MYRYAFQFHNSYYTIHPYTLYLLTVYYFSFFIFKGLYKDGPLCTFKTGSGVTQIEFSSCGTKLFSVVRKNNEFLCWDLRNPGNILYSFGGRQSNTNQRIQFDITPDTKQIISG